MAANLLETYACVPSTERGQGILISGDPKTNAIVYCNGRSVIIRYLDRPLEVVVYGEHAYQATVARFSPNGEWIASADVSGTVRIWGRHNEHVLKNEFRVLSGRIDDLQWSPDCQRIVASGEGKGKSFVRAFMWDSGTNVGEFDGHSKRVLSCAFKPSRPFRIVTCGEDYLVNFYEGPPFKFKLSQSFSCCFQVLTVSADKTAKMWEIDGNGNGKVKKTFNSSASGIEGMLVGCLWQNDHLVTVSLGGIISVYSATNLEKAPVSFSGHMKSVTGLAVFSEGGQKVILSSSYDGVIVRWIQGIGYAGRLERKDSSQIKCFAVVEGELTTFGFDNKVKRIRLLGDQCGDEEEIDIGTQPKDLNVAHDNPELALLSTDSGVVMLRGYKVLSTLNLGFVVTASAISPDGSEVIVGGEDGKLHIYSVNGDTLTEESVLEKHRGAVSVIRFSPDASMFASGDLNREAIVWDRITREVKLKNMLYHTARINCLAWSPDSTMVATGSLDTNVIIYEVNKPASNRITVKSAHLGGVYGLAFNDVQTVVSSGEDACIRLWRIVQQ
ncbi:unnamed protein product [Victoria cruziana]